ncbi:hypothetical protein ABT144_25355 [Streptomyces sp. NPDC002039]|uniref:hypothetical protein n=1 Tax=unclassified Streptomyces TaxID=2593676 RepID=UPI003324F015
MYEMRAESTSDRHQLVWHVIAKEATLNTLCGFQLGPDQAAKSMTEPGSERYCAPCMDAFGKAVHDSTKPLSPTSAGD